mgnify:CR=1 FL=1
MYLLLLELLLNTFDEQSWFLWPGTVWPVLWTLIKIVAVLLPLMACVAYLTLWERKAIGFTHGAHNFSTHATFCT